MEAKNSLENYAFNCRNSINDEKVKSKLSEADRKTIEGAVDAALKWLEDHHEAEREEFEEKQKELEAKVSPLMQKLYAGGGGGAPGGGMPSGDYDEPAPQGGSRSGPVVDEID